MVATKIVVPQWHQRRRVGIAIVVRLLLLFYCFAWDTTALLSVYFVLSHAQIYTWTCMYQGRKVVRRCLSIMFLTCVFY